MIAKRLRSLVAISLLLVSLLCITLYLKANKELVTLLANLSWEMAVWLIILRFLVVGMNGLFLKLFAARWDVQLNWHEWIGLPFITTMGNYLTPLSGGMLVRATYLKKRHALSYIHFTTLLAANYMITFWVTMVLGLFMFPFLWHQIKFNLVLLFFFITCFSFLTLLLLAPIPQFSSTRLLARILNQALAGWQKVKGDHWLVMQLILLTIISLLLNAAAFGLSYWALQVAVPAPAAVMISLSTVFSALTTLTPGNLGIREAFVVFLSEIMGVGVGSGLLVALLIRGSTLVSVFTLGPLFSVILARRICLTPLNSEISPE